jgi:hypothetical protein
VERNNSSKGFKGEDFPLSGRRLSLVEPDHSAMGGDFSNTSKRPSPETRTPPPVRGAAQTVGRPLVFSSSRVASRQSPVFSRRICVDSSESHYPIEATEHFPAHPGEGKPCGGHRHNHGKGNDGVGFELNDSGGIDED